MATLTYENGTLEIPADPKLLHSMTAAVTESLTMCDAKTKFVGLSAAPIHEPGSVTGVIGVHGKVSGFITVNMAEQVALKLATGFLQEQFDKIDNQVVDGVGEVTNLIAGGIKKRLAGTTWGFDAVTVPSVIIGRNYQIAYTKGLQYLVCTFEHENEEAYLLEHRLLHVALSLLRL
ncbi:MAG: chemotaxis protein CheX [Planctomycetota bacterium]|nr:MAG: chemotaxis protein CheX [Planctomycetota bacterium]